MFGPELIQINYWINELIKTAQSAVSKNRFFLRRQPRNSENMMMMIAFITIKSSLVPLIEGLRAQIYFRFEISVVFLTSSSFLFCERKNMLKENKKVVSPDFYL